MNQVFAITLMNLRNLPARAGASLVIVVGIAGVVAVVTALLSMAQGFQSTLKGSGDPARAFVLRGGSDTEMSSFISTEAYRIIESKPGVMRDAQGPLAAGETYVIADVPKRGNNSPANMPLRGVEPASFRVRPEVRIIEGRNLEFGRLELIAGAKAANQFQGLEVGQAINIRGANWQVVGLFTANGGIHEGEVWVDNTVLVSNLNRGGSGYTSMIVRLEAPEELDPFALALENDRRLETKVVRETTYYSEQSEGLTGLITNFGYSIGLIMAFGAIFGALNTMYSAVSTRSVEIATLRAIGFGPTPIVVSVMVEALVLAVLGGAIGGGIAYLFFNGYTASTMGDTFSQVSFDFRVTPDLLVRGIIWSCLLGLIGGLFPSIAAARQPVVTALRGL
ncbi:MAG: ABC transporter permease [Pseudomonadota bacterium]